MTDQSEHSAESTPPDNLAIDGKELFQQAMEADESGKWGNDGAFEMPPKEEPSGDRAPDESGDVETPKDKAEPSAEPKEHTGHPESPVIDSLGREHDPKTGRLLPKKDDSEQVKAQEAPEAKPETPYSKAKKEEERQKSLLANFERDKAEARAQIEAERQQLAAEKAQIERFRQIPRAKDGSPHKFNSSQYTEAADDFYGRAKAALAQGDIEKSNEYLAQAELCSQSAAEVAKFEQQVAQEQSSRQYQSMWEQNMDYTIHQDESLRDPENPVTKEINGILADKDWGPILERIPNGFGVAAQLMRWKVAAAENSALSEKLKKTEAENADFRRRLQIRPASVSGGMPQPTSFENLSDEAKRRELMREAFEQDRVPSFG